MKDRKERVMKLMLELMTDEERAQFKRECRRLNNPHDFYLRSMIAIKILDEAEAGRVAAAVD